MALPWKLILTNVPWSDVLGKAPIIADSAKKLWKGMSRKMATGPDQIRWLNLTSRRTRIWPRGLLRWKASNENCARKCLRPENSFRR